MIINCNLKIREECITTTIEHIHRYEERRRGCLNIFFLKIDLNSTLNDVYRQQNGRNVIFEKKGKRQRKFQLHCQHKSYVFDIFFPRLLLLYGTSQCVKKNRHNRIDSNGNKMIVYLELKSDQSLNVCLWAFTYPSMFLIPFFYFVYHAVCFILC